MGFSVRDGMPMRSIVDLFGRNRHRDYFNNDPEPIKYTNPVYYTNHFEDEDLFEI